MDPILDQNRDKVKSDQANKGNEIEIKEVQRLLWFVFNDPRYITSVQDSTDSYILK